MPRTRLPLIALRRHTHRLIASCAIAFLIGASGCGTSTGVQTSTSTSTTPTAGPQTYFAPIVAASSYSTATAPNSSSLLTSMLTYTLDDTALSFSQTSYLVAINLDTGLPAEPQILSAGNMAVSQRGLRSLGITANYVPSGTLGQEYVAVPHNPEESGSFAVEMANQAGALVQLIGQPATPMAPATACPSSSPQTYLFLTIPGGMTSTTSQYAWNPATDTAYGVANISASGGTVNFKNIQQFMLPSAGGTGAPAQPGPASTSGVCASTLLGYTTIVPGQQTVTDPESNNPVPPQATLAIGPTGLLVEDNGSAATTTLPNTSPAISYENFLGAGTGAIGLPQPSAAVSTGSVVSAQYLGFIYGAGVHQSSSAPPAGWSSHLASFGFASVPSACASVAASTSTLLYGGDFPQSNGQDNPAASSSGYGNCDFAVDLGQQSSTNGLYLNATVWIGASYAANTSGATYSFPAVAIAGELDGKYAIFVLGTDSIQPWAIYLFQSN